MNGPFRPKYRYELKAELVRRGFKSNREAAEAMGYSVATVGSLVNGWRMPSPDVQGRLCKLLGCGFMELKELI